MPASGMEPSISVPDFYEPEADPIHARNEATDHLLVRDDRHNSDTFTSLRRAQLPGYALWEPT